MSRIRFLVGDCRETLRSLPADSVQAVITSPPYYGLRDYGTPPLVWGGDPSHEHVWGLPIPGDSRGGSGTPTNKNGRGEQYGRAVEKGAYCHCGAWLGSLGLEPSPDLFIAHLVEVFREVRRVLRPDGVAWVNMGDSYASHDPGGPRAGEFLNPGGRQSTKPGATTARNRAGTYRPDGLKAKDLMMMPARLAIALQADGWWLRSQIPWIKRNAMPESMTGRPATAVEYVFQLTKASRCYWDADAVRIASNPERTQWTPGNKFEKVNDTTGRTVRNDGLAKLGARMNEGLASGRNRRNSDWFLESWQGLMLDEADDPMALVVNPSAFKGSHFATFPPRLVEPMVKASTSEKGQCPECGAPWERVVKRTAMVVTPSARRSIAQAAGVARGRMATSGTMIEAPTSVTTGWRPSCSHTDLTPVPQTVLDPFGGAGTVGLVADRLGRDAVLCELKQEYADMATERLRQDSPLFTEIGT